MKMYDRSGRVLDIRLKQWDGTQYGPDFSNDFFEAGELLYNRDIDAYLVDDVDYCRDRAIEWQEGEGEFAPEDDNIGNKIEELENRSVFYDAYTVDDIAKDISPMNELYEYDQDSDGMAEMHRLSRTVDMRCKNAIEKAVEDGYDGSHLDTSGIKAIIDKYGADRVESVLAETVRSKDRDGRFSVSNKEWAKTVQPCPEDDARHIVIDKAHPVLVNAFVDAFRKANEQPVKQHKERDCER